MTDPTPSEFDAKLDGILEQWLNNAMSTSSLGWSPIDGYKGAAERSEEAAEHDYDQYKAEARAAIRAAVREMVPKPKPVPPLSHEPTSVKNIYAEDLGFNDAIAEMLAGIGGEQ